MFSIKNLILERQKYALGVNTNPLRDELLSHIIMEASEDEIAFLTVSSTLFEKRKAEALQEKRADFIDYINAIKYIRRSRWVDEAAKAHENRMMT